MTRNCIFGFKVLPFGLCNAPSTFQHLVDLALRGKYAWQNGELKVIGYASKAFSDSELWYCRELTAIMFGLKYYRHFLLGYKFVLSTNHAALTHLRKTPHPVPQSVRYLDTLGEYDFSVQYRPGESHRNADALSRYLCSRDLNSPLCKQCGPLLDPIDESEEDEQEVEEESEMQEESSNSEQEVKGGSDSSENDSKSADEEAAVVETMLRAEAPIFVPRVKSEEMWREREGCEVEHISGEMDRLIETADETELFVSSLTPEENSYELHARLTKATPRKGRNGLTTETKAEVLSVENLRAEQRNDVELKEVIKWIEDFRSI